MDKESKLKTVFTKIKSVKHIEIIIAMIAVVVMLVIYFTTLSPSADKTTVRAQSSDSNDYCGQMKQEIANAVADMCGATPTVVINWESSVESVIAYVTSASGSNTASTPQIISSQGSSSPIVLKEIYPKALGVIVICQGGDNIKTKLDIITAVSTLLNITPEKINVFPAKK